MDHFTFGYLMGGLFAIIGAVAGYAVARATRKK